MQANVESYKNFSIPLDGIFLDVSYMINGQDFTVDNGTGGSFEGVTEAVESWHTENKSVVPVLRAGFAYEYSKYAQMAEE